MTLTALIGGHVIDPVDGSGRRDIYMRDGKIIAQTSERVTQRVDVSGKIIMAGGIDMHSHIAGGKVNIARLLLPEEHRRHPQMGKGWGRSGSGLETMTSFATGYNYAAMGYTAAFEPAMIAANARQTHSEMMDIPLIDKGAYVMLGNDDFLLRLLQRQACDQTISDYVGWTIKASRALGVKVVNPGGISAFKFNQRRLDLDQNHPHYDQVTPRLVLQRLAKALVDLGVPHALHVHGCNLGIPGNATTTLDTIQGIEGLPMHLTHIQFHAYGNEGERKFSSAGALIAEAVNNHSNITIDVGQVMFGQTVTASGDIMRQYAAHKLARPRKWYCMDIECQGACGLVPFNYRDKNFVNALQWLIGLEIFLLVDDPWRVFLTTDHPNGGAFTHYPHLIRLLMDKSFRLDMMKNLPKAALEASCLTSIKREYSLEEIAIITRAGPARLLGLNNHGRLGVGAQADIAVYAPQEDKQAMFTTPDYVFKDGHLIARQGDICHDHRGRSLYFDTSYDPAVHKVLDRWFSDYHGVQRRTMEILDDDFDPISWVKRPCHHQGR